MSARIVLESLPAAVAHVKIDDAAQKVNTLSAGLWKEMHDVLEVVARGDFRGLVLSSGKPGQFIAGADLNELRRLMDRHIAEIDEAMNLGRRVLARLATLPIPTVAAIGGHCLGGGLEVALACDARVVVNDPKHKLGLPETRLGLIPGWGGTQRLPRIIGVRLAAEMIFTGLPINPEQAKSVGLAQLVADSTSLLSTACATVQHMNARGDWNSSRAARLAIPTLTSQDRVFLTELAARSSASQIACAVALQVIEAGWQTDLEPGLRYEAEAFAKLMSIPSARDAVDAFLAKSAAASPRPVATSG